MPIAWMRWVTAPSISWHRIAPKIRAIAGGKSRTWARRCRKLTSLLDEFADTQGVRNDEIGHAGRAFSRRFCRIANSRCPWVPYGGAAAVHLSSAAECLAHRLHRLLR